MLQRGVYKKSSYSGSSCVEAAVLANGAVDVRNTRDKGSSSPHLTYTRAEWQAFVDGVKAGEFDYPA